MSLKNGAIMSQREKFELINSEVRSFYEYCKEAGISDEEMDIICRPLTNAVRKASFKWWTRLFLFLIMVMAIGFTVSQTDTFQWHVSAVARTLLIKVLPVWDWTPLYNNKCLIERPRPPSLDGNIVSPADCIACEAINHHLHNLLQPSASRRKFIDGFAYGVKFTICCGHGMTGVLELPPLRSGGSIFCKKMLTVTTTECKPVETSGKIEIIVRVSDSNYNEVFNHHLSRGAPVIVSDAYYDWSVYRSELNLTGLISDDDRLRVSVPCRILSNIRIGRQPMDLEEIVTRITNNDIPSWFVHYQNCDIRAVKAFRVLAPRPYFLSPHIPPSHFNWLLLSKNYDTHRFKNLELDVGLIVMSQLKGKNYIQLKPRTPCEDDCYILNFELIEGETLVLGNSLWEFEYLPGKGENVAMITETDWVES